MRWRAERAAGAGSEDPGWPDRLDISNNHGWLLNTGSKMTSDL